MALLSVGIISFSLKISLLSTLICIDFIFNFCSTNFIFLYINKQDNMSNFRKCSRGGCGGCLSPRQRFPSPKSMLHLEKTFKLFILENKN